MLGNLYIVAAPSGAGKTSLVNALIKQDKHLYLSISHTTRPKRPGEQEGINYHFIDITEFEKLIAQDAFFEYANVYGNFYGTTKQWVMQQLQTGQDVILEIDWQGAEQIKKLHPPTVMIFIFPPSRAVLEARLIGRGQDSPEVIAKRVQAAAEDIAHAGSFDYWIINQDFNVALADLQNIINAERLRQNPQKQRYPDLTKSW